MQKLQQQNQQVNKNKVKSKLKQIVMLMLNKKMLINYKHMKNQLQL